VDNRTRLAKLKEAERLIREVEFSYAHGSDERTRLYRVVVQTFSFLGALHSLVTSLKLEILAEERASKDQAASKSSTDNPSHGL
jgi:hypothetical protein